MPLLSAQSVILLSNLDPSPAFLLAVFIPVMNVAPARFSEISLSSSSTLNPAVATGSPPFSSGGMYAPFSYTTGCFFSAGAGVSTTGASATGAGAGAGATGAVAGATVLLSSCISALMSRLGN